MDQKDRLKKKSNHKTENADTLLKLYQIYDNHRMLSYGFWKDWMQATIRNIWKNILTLRVNGLTS
jgi:hypothetical protein